jgi:hypothetical protein
VVERGIRLLRRDAHAAAPVAPRPETAQSTAVLASAEAATASAAPEAAPAPSARTTAPRTAA